MAQTTGRSATPSTEGDVIAFLIDQHQQVRTLLDEVVAATGEQRQRRFDTLREMLARHETAEEMVLHPLTRTIPDGDHIAQRRMDEENQATEELAELEKMEVDSATFAAAFDRFRTAVLSHAEAEEQQEFPALRASIDADKLASAQQRVEKAEAIAPTHPHPSAKTTAMNYIAGPFAAMLDRARDAFSKSS